MIKYTWLTPDEAGCELFNGNSVIKHDYLSYINYIKENLSLSYGSIITKIDDKRLEEIDRIYGSSTIYNLSNFKKHHNKNRIVVRKPLTPKEIISNGNRLLGYINGKFYNYPIVVVYVGDNYSDVIVDDEAKSIENSNIKYVTNKNGEYISIVDGICCEIFR